MALLDLQGIPAENQASHHGRSSGSVLLCTGYSCVSLLLCC